MKRDHYTFKDKLYSNIVSYWNTSKFKQAISQIFRQKAKLLERKQKS